MGGVGPIPMYVLQVEERTKPTDTPSATKGDNVIVNLPFEIDPEAPGSKFCMPARLNIIDWSKANSPS